MSRGAQVTPLALALLVFASVALMLAPRRWVLLPLLAVACYAPAYLDMSIGIFTLTAVRLLVAIGVMRAAIRGERPRGPINGLDRAMLLWAIWLIVSASLHDDPLGALKFRLGMAYDSLGLYLLVRCYCRSGAELIDLLRITSLLLAGLALAVAYEKLTGTNPFSALGGVDPTSQIRGGNVRAQGPFGHPILAGTVGAVCLPLMLSLWRIDRKASLVGLAACVVIMVSAASSGPILSGAAGLFALWVWRYRRQVRVFQTLAILAYVLLDLVMKDPAYFLVARIDLAGGSTSWYRARLIQSAFEHLPEWWIAGTDYTYHWMGIAVPWSTRHTDITSHYIQMGVWGGLPLLLLFVLILAKGFRGVARKSASLDASPAYQFTLWAMGSSLFAFAVTGLSVSFFDQSITFLYLTLGVIASAWSEAISSGRQRAIRVRGLGLGSVPLHVSPQP